MRRLRRELAWLWLWVRAHALFALDTWALYWADWRREMGAPPKPPAVTRERARPVIPRRVA